jgi:membrane-associated protease RseP (regulator of RpoE activity)
MPGNTPGWLGIEINDLTASFRQQFAIPAFRGAAIVNVTAGSPAYKSEIRAGDVIVEANATPIEGERDLLAWLSGTRSGEFVELTVYRGSAVRRVQLVLEVSPESRVARASPIPKTAPIANPATAFPDVSSLAVPLPVTPDIASQPATQQSAFPQLRPSDDAVELESSPPDDSLEEANQRLRSENARLQAELQRAHKQLEELQERLDRIQKALQGTNAQNK